jgi:hypothetical protein
VTDVDALDAIADVCALRGGDLSGIGIERLRAAHTLMGELTPIVGTLLRDADEKELADARARVAEIEGRLKITPKTVVFNTDHLMRAESKPSPALSDYAQTDAGMGIGGREPDMAAQDFRDELAELRERGAAKHRRREA